MTHRRAEVVALLLVAAGVMAVAQDPDPVEVRTRLAKYLVGYEAELGNVVAEERMLQWPLERREVGMSAGAGSATELRRDLTRVRTLVSEVAFVPLPGNVGWLGYRNVLQIGGRPVNRKGPPLLDLLKAQTDDATERAGLLLVESARHNLGAPRTINLPSLPLELLHARHQARFVIETTYQETVANCRALRLDLVETARPTIIRRPEGGDMPSRVIAWVEIETGRLCKAEVRTRDARIGVPQFTAVVAVEFQPDAGLGILVPAKMTERFFIPTRSEGESEATYSNYRRFMTSGRLVPPGAPNY